MADTEMYSLVLSIFKGENFVVKGGNGKAFLRARCGDLQPDLCMETGSTKLTGGNPEPEFNSQLAWSLTRKQLKDLRSNRSTIKVSCIVADEKTNHENEVGYVILHVKDATGSTSGEVDPTKAVTYPLLGTKELWRTFQPKLQMILQLEEVGCRSEKTGGHMESLKSGTQRKLVMGGVGDPLVFHLDADPPNTDSPIKNAAKLSETKVLQQKSTDRFRWSVNEEEGHFLLGTEGDSDDLYVFNTTIISASYLHCLWDGKSARNKVGGTGDANYFWQIKYIAYGCEIASEPFLLTNTEEDLSRRTFIGDKATARIRANGAHFFNYLEETTVEFQIIRYQLDANKELGNPEIMGLCYATLHELTSPEMSEHRVMMDVVSEWGTPRVISATEKPEVRVIFTLAAVVNYFTLLNQKFSSGAARHHLQAASNPVNPPKNQQTASSSKNNKIEGQRKFLQQKKTPEGKVKKSEKFLAGIPEDVPDAAGTDDDIAGAGALNSDNSSARRLLQFEEENSSPPSTNSHSAAQTEGRGNNRGNSNTSSLNFDSDESDLNSNRENLANILPEPGEYKVTIELSRFWLKSRKLIEDSFQLAYVHPPLGISDEPIESLGEPMSADFTSAKQGFMIFDGTYTKIISIAEFSESLLNDPLTVEFFRQNSEGVRSGGFASAMIPFGRIFSEKSHDQTWILEYSVDILKLVTNIKIGELFFKVKLCRETDLPLGILPIEKNRKSTAFFPTRSPKDEKSKIMKENENKCNYDNGIKDKVMDNLKEFRKAQEEIYKRQTDEKVAAYLTILSAEAAQRDAERESAMSKKMKELEKKEKELKSQRQKLEEREERLRQEEFEIKDNARQLVLDQESVQQHAGLSQRRLEEQHHIEVESLNRRILEYKGEVEKWKSKVLVLEKKMESKEAEIDGFLALKREKPDSKLKEKVSLLEQENKSLKTHLREAITRKEQYKKQSIALCQKLSRMQEERDHELKDQNENLRLQILASKEHKDLKKERKAVQDLSHTLKALQKENVSRRPNFGEGDRIDKAIDDHYENVQKEIKRLAEERTKLLGTGAYTCYDKVIKELESRMKSLTYNLTSVCPPRKKYEKAEIDNHYS